MHEMSLARSLMNQLEALCRQERAQRITAIRLRVGEFSGVEPDLLQEACQRLSEGTCLDNAEVKLDIVSLAARCQMCGDSFRVEDFVFECPRCDSRRVTVTAGEELQLESVTFVRSEVAW